VPLRNIRELQPPARHDVELLESFQPLREHCRALRYGCRIKYTASFRYSAFHINSRAVGVLSMLM
jgi:hypothetical protein